MSGVSGQLGQNCLRDPLQLLENGIAYRRAYGPGRPHHDRAVAFHRVQLDLALLTLRADRKGFRTQRGLSGYGHFLRALLGAHFLHHGHEILDLLGGFFVDRQYHQPAGPFRLDAARGFSERHGGIVVLAEERLEIDALQHLARHAFILRRDQAADQTQRQKNDMPQGFHVYSSMAAAVLSSRSFHPRNVTAIPRTLHSSRASLRACVRDRRLPCSGSTHEARLCRACVRPAVNQAPLATATALIRPNTASATLSAIKTWVTLPLQRKAIQPPPAAIASRVRFAVRGQMSRPAPCAAK